MQTKSEEKPYFIGVIDSSGSMSGCWKDLSSTYNLFITELSESLGVPVGSPQIKTFCFDSTIHQVPSGRLEPSLYSHGGGMTNIVESMRQMEVELKSIPVDSPVWVVFISDGDDTCNGGTDTMMNKLGLLQGNINRKNLNFMCLGVGANFPTRVSMYLREKYHRGNEAVPSIFCIEYISEKAFKNKLDGVLAFCEVRGIVELDQGVIFVPWEGENKTANENQWVVSRSSKLRMGRKGVSLMSNSDKYNDITVEVESKIEDFSIEAVAEVFRGWSQKL